MKFKDTSNHPKENTAPSFGMSEMKNDGGISNPGSVMPEAHHSIKHGEARGKYMPDVMDHDGEDMVTEIHPDAGEVSGRRTQERKTTM